MKKIVIASDIHGSAYWCEKLLSFFENAGAEKLVLLGDLLYHGPRNPLPLGYDTLSVTKQLNAYKEKIVAVRGNCDSEVDQMVLEFPCLADYALLPWGERTLFLTHGHLTLPTLEKNVAVVQGHTHLAGVTTGEQGGQVFNDGSVALPKSGKPHSCILLEDDLLSWIDLETGAVFFTQKL
ncbi:MAG: phosphodiesterase [Clostridia bacterium]|nr:phosphodiesterase [Clostridia bacterium]